MEKLKRRILLEAKSVSVCILLLISFVGYTQGLTPYYGVSDTLLCWDLRGSKKLYASTVKAKYCDSISAVNDTIIYNLSNLVEVHKKDATEVKIRLKEKEKELKVTKKYGYSIFALLGLAVGLFLK